MLTAESERRVLSRIEQSRYVWRPAEATAPEVGLPVEAVRQVLETPFNRRRDIFSDPVCVLKFFGHPVVGAFLAFVLFKSWPCVVNEIAALVA